MLLDDKIFTEKEILEFSEWHKILKTKKWQKASKNQITEKDIWLLQNPCPISKQIKIKYDKGYGLKVISRNLGITYTQSRSLFPQIGVILRCGYDVSTTVTKKFRKEKAKNEIKTNTGFYSPDILRKALKYTRRGVQGYYFNKAKHKKVWLRSSYEYIFAKWLDLTLHNWDVECSTFILPNNERYKPDFFIFDENNSLKKIIEVKGYWDNRAYKINLLDSILEVPVILIDNLTEFIPENSSYQQEMKNWKKEIEINA